MMIFMMMSLMRIWHWRRCGCDMMIMMMVFLMMVIFMVKLLMFTIVMMGRRRSNQSSWLPMVWPSMGLSLQNIRGERSAITHSIAVSEVSMVPLLLQTLFQISINMKMTLSLFTLGLQNPNSEQQGAWGGQPFDQQTSCDLKGVKSIQVFFPFLQAYFT